MMKVWTGAADAGLLDRHGTRGSSFVYLPEGVLRERLRLAFAKATGTFDEFDLLGIVGRSQIGRIRYTGQKEKLQEIVFGKPPAVPPAPNKPQTRMAVATIPLTTTWNSPYMALTSVKR